MNVIIKPIITEESMKNAGKNKFSFLVTLDATKNQIKNEIKGLFKVNPISISTSILKGKTMRSGSKRTLKSIKNIKRALVELKKGEKIDLFEGEK